MKSRTRSSFWDTASGQTLSVLLLIFAVTAIWELAVIAYDIKPFLLPAPSKVLLSIFEKPGWYMQHAWHTLLETLLGFFAAILLGGILAIAITYSRILERTLYTLLVALNAVPKIAIAPLFIVWLGAGLEPKVAIALLIAIFPIVISAVLGLKSVDPDMLDLAKAMKANPVQILYKIRLPNALPSIFAGLKVGISLAFIGAIVGEFVASQYGLGYVVMSSQANFDTTQMFAAIVLLAVIGTLLFYLIDRVETASIPWHVSKRRKIIVSEP